MNAFFKSPRAGSSAILPRLICFTLLTLAVLAPVA